VAGTEAEVDEAAEVAAAVAEVVTNLQNFNLTFVRLKFKS
jgi:hypothetical protein